MSNLLNWDPENGFSGWTEWSPMPGLSPHFSVDSAGKQTSLCLRGGGNRHVFGAWCQRIPIQPGQAYQLEVNFRYQGMTDLSLHITPHIVWRRGDLAEEGCAGDTVYTFSRSSQNGQIAGRNTFVAPVNCDGAEVRLLLRYAPDGIIWFDRVSLVAEQSPTSRPVGVGAMRFRPPYDANQDDHLRLYADQIDRLSHTDIVLLPEFANTASLPQKRGLELWQVAEEIPGPFCQMLSQKAIAYQTYVCAGILEREGDFIFNCAVLYDRQGELVGKQRKVHPYWPEEPLGVSPGDEFNVFSTDFGTVGMMICYDSWWPESARLLALKGAELILFPNAGYEEKILPARAIDNNVFLVASTLNSPAAIIDPKGETLAVSAVDNVLSAVIDLNTRPKCHPNAGGNLNPGPGGARWARNSNSNRLYQQILEAVQESVV